jgi:hypothetical protein
MAPYPKEAHDDWTAALVEDGMLGLVGMLLLVGEFALRASWVGGSRRPEPGRPAGLPAPEFLVGALATVAIYSYTHQILHDRTAWTLFGILAAFSLLHRERRRAGSPAIIPAANGRAR